ncbi:MAG: M23 family metallopeptidase [Gemmatimonadales bacterium]|nr:MAG: M23 family metallopeptidase [Gemmatimonadales bacterium]
MRRTGRSLLAGLVVLLVTAGCSIPRWPLDGPMSSPFGLRVRSGAILPTVHHGVDIPVPTGTPVLAALPGNVRFAGVMGGYGNVIWLEHRGGALTVYAHLSTMSVRTGDRVRGRQEIARSGATGNVSGPHLHFEVWKGGRPVDPVQALGRRPRLTGGR